MNTSGRAYTDQHHDPRRTARSTTAPAVSVNFPSRASSAPLVAQVRLIGLRFSASHSAGDGVAQPAPFASSLGFGPSGKRLDDLLASRLPRLVDLGQRTRLAPLVGDALPVGQVALDQEQLTDEVERFERLGIALLLGQVQLRQQHARRQDAQYLESVLRQAAIDHMTLAPPTPYCGSFGHRLCRATKGRLRLLARHFERVHVHVPLLGAEASKRVVVDGGQIRLGELAVVNLSERMG